MTPSLELIEQFAPLIISVSALLPILFLYALYKDKNPNTANNNSLTVYLIALLVVSAALLILKAIEVISINNSDRTLFICAVLVVACVDQSLILFPFSTRRKFDLTIFLFYLVILLSAIPLLWQILKHVVSPEITSQVSVMNTIQIILSLALVALCFINGFLKKTKNRL